MSQSEITKPTRMAKGSHLAPKRRRRRRNTSRGGRVSGVPGAYWGANLKRVEHSSHLPLVMKITRLENIHISDAKAQGVNLPSPRVTSNHEVKQSWCVNPIDPEHLHGLNRGRLSKRDGVKIQISLQYFIELIKAHTNKTGTSNITNP